MAQLIIRSKRTMPASAGFCPPVLIASRKPLGFLTALILHFDGLHSDDLGDRLDVFEKKSMWDVYATP